MIDLNKIALQIGERIREKATLQGRIPFLTGDLRKSIYVTLVGQGSVSIGSNLSYARAVHDGRPAITIRPKNKKALRWKDSSVKGGYRFAKYIDQPARKGRPFLREAVEEIQREGFAFLMPELNNQIGSELAKEFSGKIKIDINL
jgi:hypothetical protein